MLKIFKYNRQIAVEYAIKYSLQRNKVFHDYTNQGGNCSNFCSQCLYAGAPVMNFSNNGWFYITPSNTSISWANVEPLYNFLTTNNSVGVFAKQTSLQLCEPGDLIQLKFYNKPNFSHCLFVTKVDAPNINNILVCANTRDILNKPVSFYKFQEMRVIHILGYRNN